MMGDLTEAVARQLTDIVKELRDEIAKSRFVNAHGVYIETPIASALLARLETAERERDVAKAALTEMDCPRPANGRPEDETAGSCNSAGVCGCVARLALSAARRSPAHESSE